MENEPGNFKFRSQKEYSRHIGAKADRKLRAKSEEKGTSWFGLGMMGIIGWSVVIPTLLGVAIGSWLDGHFQGSYSWTLMMLALGLMLGCLNAWFWIKKEEGKTHKSKDINNGGRRNNNIGGDNDE